MSTRNSSTPTSQELEAQSQAAAAQIVAISATQRERVAHATAEHAAREAERAAADVRLAGYQRAIEEAGATAERERRYDFDSERTRLEEHRRRAAEATAVLAEQPRHVDMAEFRETLARADRILDATVGAEHRQRVKEMDQYESRRLHDSAFRQAFDASHPGGANHCQCTGHQAWREALADGSLNLRRQREA